jgi:hypothetical protein
MGFDPAQAGFVMTAITHHQLSSTFRELHEIRRLHDELREAS